MSKLVVVASHGYEDPTKAGLAFLFAKGAVEAGHQAEVILAGGRRRAGAAIGCGRRRTPTGP
jgi:hypothetical protein